MRRPNFSSSPLTAAITGKVGVRVDFARLHRQAHMVRGQQAAKPLDQAFDGEHGDPFRSAMSRRLSAMPTCRNTPTRSLGDPHESLPEIVHCIFCCLAALSQGERRMMSSAMAADVRRQVLTYRAASTLPSRASTRDPLSGWRTSVQ